MVHARTFHSPWCMQGLSIGACKYSRSLGLYYRNYGFEKRSGYFNQVVLFSSS